MLKPILLTVALGCLGHVSHAAEQTTLMVLSDDTVLRGQLFAETADSYFFETTDGVRLQIPVRMVHVLVRDMPETVRHESRHARSEDVVVLNGPVVSGDGVELVAQQSSTAPEPGVPGFGAGFSLAGGFGGTGGGAGELALSYDLLPLELRFYHATGTRSFDVSVDWLGTIISAAGAGVAAVKVDAFEHFRMPSANGGLFAVAPGLSLTVGSVQNGYGGLPFFTVGVPFRLGVDMRPQATNMEIGIYARPHVDVTTVFDGLGNSATALTGGVMLETTFVWWSAR